MITELVTHLRDDATLAGLLADAPWGAPGVFVDWSPEHSRPYVLLTFDESLDTPHVADGEIVLDIWGDGTSAVEIEPIRDALFDALDHVIVDTDRGPVRFFWTGDGPERDDDPSLVRWRATFAFRRGRTEHVD